MSVPLPVAEKRNPVTGADVAALRAAVQGNVHGPDEFGYDDARAVFNAAVNHRPGAIVTVSSVDDVRTTLALAHRNGYAISVRGAGHGVAGRAVAGDVVIDLSALRGVVIDAGARTATVRGGTLWAELDAIAHAYGLAVPGARVGTTGVAGVTLGGGEGWLSGEHGMTCDNLLAAEIVTADGRLVVASPEREPELFWAVRGAGANFGVVTSLTLRLHRVGPRVLGGMLLFRLSDAADVLGTLAELHDLGHERFAGAAAIMHAPAAAFVPGDVVGRPVLAVVPAFTDDPAAGEPFVSRLRVAAQPLADSARPMSYLGLQAEFDAAAPPGLRRAWAASHVDRPTAALVDDLEAAGADLPGPHSKIILRHFGGAATRPAEDTAVAHRAPSWLVHPAAQWTGENDDARHRAWIRSLDSRLRLGEIGTYLSLTDDCESRVREAYGAQRFERLAAVKAAWDPDDVFRHCAHVPPIRSGASA